MDPQKKNEDFMRLYTPVHLRLCRYVQSMVWNREEAKDLISEVTLLAYERFDQLKLPDKFVYFLFSIARNQFLNKLRRQKFKANWNEEEMDLHEGPYDAESAMRRRELATLLARIKPVQKEAITLYEVAGFSYEEIAVIQSVSLSSVKSHIYKGRQALKQIIEQESIQLKQAEKLNTGSNLTLEDSL